MKASPSSNYPSSNSSVMFFTKLALFAFVTFLMAGTAIAQTDTDAAKGIGTASSQDSKPSDSKPNASKKPQEKLEESAKAQEKSGKQAKPSILLVDGDIQSRAADSETDALAMALAPKGYTDNLVDVVSESELPMHSISPYQVIYICNVDTVSEGKMAELEKWVADGGGLVIMPGDQIAAEDFNKNFYKDGKGVSPVRLTEAYGDPKKKRFKHFSIPKTPHRIVEISSVFVSNVKIFSWWGSVIDPEQKSKAITLIAKLTDARESPAIVEKSFGKGRVLYYAIPADLAWTNWPNRPSYLVTMHETVEYLCDNRATAGELRTGGEEEVKTEQTTIQLSEPSVDSHDSEGAKDLPGDSQESLIKD